MVKIVEFDRNTTRKTRNKLVVLGLEGKNNKTEMLYFRELEKKLNNVHFCFACKNTDPVNITNYSIDKAKKEEIDKELGDFVAVIFDVDNDSKKETKITTANKIAKKSNYEVEIFTSNPCFEIWYIEHFVYTTKSFVNSRKVKQEMNTYIDNYEKNLNIFNSIYPKTEQAIANIKKLRNHHEINTKNARKEYWNPYTEIDILLSKLFNYIK